MPQAAPFFTAFLYGAAAGASATLVAAAALGTLVQVAIVNAVLGKLARAFGPKRSTGTGVPTNVTVRNSTESRRVIFGKTRAGGVIVYYNTAGTKKDELYYVVAYAGHQVNAIKDVWLDSIKILNANINAGTGAVTQGDYTGKLSIWKHLGTSAQTADSTLTTAFSGTWTANHKLQGIAYIVVKMLRDDKAFPSGPAQNVTALVEGAKLYDPRLDSTNGGSGSQRYTDATTWTYPTNPNPALALRWVLTGGTVANDVATPQVKYGLKDEQWRIADDYLMAAANKCDELLTGAYTTPLGDQYRYSINVELSTGQTPREWIEIILATMAGVCVEVSGKKRVYAGSYDSPVHVLTDADVYGESLEISDTFPHEDRYNAVSATYRDAANEYIEATTQFRTDTSYETQDNGERLPREIDLLGVDNDPQAQRLCEIHKRKSRLMRMVKLPGALNLLKVAPWETLTLTNIKYVWTNRVFRELERNFEFAEDAGKVVATLQVESSAVYTDMLLADYLNANTHTPITNVEKPDSPTSLTATSIIGGIRFDVGLPAHLNGATVLELFEYTSSTPYASATKVDEFVGSVCNYITRDATTRYYWVRALDRNTGEASVEYPTSSAGVSGAGAIDTIVSHEPANGTFGTAAISASPGFTDSTGIASATWTNNTGVTIKAEVSYSMSGVMNGVDASIFYRMYGQYELGASAFPETVLNIPPSATADTYTTRSGVFTVSVGNGVTLTATARLGLLCPSGSSPTPPGVSYKDIKVRIVVGRNQ